MSILKTTVKVESTTLFPTPVNYTSINNNDVEGDSSFGTIHADADSVAELNTAGLGAHGAFVYLNLHQTMLLLVQLTFLQVLQDLQ